jgi:NAD+ synthase (glutamine-hydrolysing)
MKDGFLKVCAATPDIRVADCGYNVEKIVDIIKKQAGNGVKLLVFPELVITGYTCQDLFLQELLLKEARAGLKAVMEASRGMDMLIFVGLPFSHRGKLYNVAAAVQDGRLLGMVPKKYMPNYAEFYEMRHFYPGKDEVEWISLPEFSEERIPFGRNLLFSCKEMEELCVAAELCEDLWTPVPPSSFHALYGATVIVNLSASDDNTGKDAYRRELVKNQSARLVCGYLYASAGEGESTQDLVFGGHNMICENGAVLAEGKRFENGCILTELDVRRLVSDRRRMTTFYADGVEKGEGRNYVTVGFSLSMEKTHLTRTFPQKPFVPSRKEDRDKRCEEILTIQALGLKKRIVHTHCESVVIGISGGLDSTLALLVAAKAFDMIGMDRAKIISVTMPCFGTTDRTYHNAVELTKRLGATLFEIPIKDAVNQHFKDISHDPAVHDVTYENSQARERTMILMNVANQHNGMVVGTGDMSELALGWATYNGDHMSMYGVNASVPKTLVRYLVLYYAETSGDETVREILMDVLDTPVSPELLPPKDGEISQKTEDLVGPYELHDFYLYYCLRFGMMPSKIYRLACETFAGVYDEDVIYKWLRTFYYRFFAQQFKRSCLPDGPKVGSVCVSPRGDLRMPSDAVWEIWRADLERKEEEGKQ